MGLRSKNFEFLRLNKAGELVTYLDSDLWYPTHPDYKWNEVSSALPAGGYYGSTTGLHTLSFTLRNFVGRIFVQGTLASTPTEDDWFNIDFCKCGLAYVEIAPQDIKSLYNSERVLYQYGSTGTFSETVQGNFTYIRVKIDRDYISTDPTLAEKNNVGRLEEILINF